MKKLYEFLFNRWKVEVIEEGWDRFKHQSVLWEDNGYFYKEYVKYKYTNKFDGSVKIKKKYLN